MKSYGYEKFQKLKIVEIGLYQNRKILPKKAREEREKETTPCCF
jgi:hypothetical protein